MNINLIYFIFFSIFFLLSTLGYGLIFQRFFLKRNFFSNLALSGIFGLFTLYIISSISHLIFAHNYAHNAIVHVIGITSFLYFNLTKQVNKKQSILIFIFFLILFTGFLISKTNEDFPYYHFPNSLQFAEQKLQFGLGNLNHGFKHFSSLFLVNSLFYFPVIKYYLFNITNFLFQIFFFSGLFIYLDQKKFDNFSNVLISFTIIIYLTKFNRLSEYGADMAGQFLVLLSFILCTSLISIYKKNKNEINELFSIIIYLNLFAFTTKFVYLIYILIPFSISLFILNFKILSKELLNFKFLFLSFFCVLSLIFFNFSSTGCLIYPIESTCFSGQFDWALKTKTVEYLNFHYEVWAKAGKGAGYSLENLEEYVKGLNWLPSWINLYFFNKVSDYILLILFILIIFYLTFFTEIKNSVLKETLKFKFFSLNYLMIIIIFLVWFLNFPTLRYAGYSIVFLLIMFPASYFLSKKLNFSDKKVIKKFKFLIIISFVIFNVRNINRINSELSLNEKQNHNFNNFPFYWIDEVNYEDIKVDDIKVYKVKNGKMCWNTPSPCVRSISNLQIKQKNGYLFYSTKK